MDHQRLINGLSVFQPTEALLLACAVPAWSLALDFVDVDLMDLGADGDVLSFNAAPLKMMNEFMASQPGRP